MFFSFFKTCKNTFSNGLKRANNCFFLKTFQTILFNNLVTIQVQNNDWPIYFNLQFFLTPPLTRCGDPAIRYKESHQQQQCFDTTGSPVWTSSVVSLVSLCQHTGVDIKVEWRTVSDNSSFLVWALSCYISNDKTHQLIKRWQTCGERLKIFPRKKTN